MSIEQRAMQTYQYIDRELWLQARAAAVAGGYKTIGQWLAEAIKEKIDRSKSSER